MSDDSDARVHTAHFDGNSLPPEQRLAAWDALTPGYEVRLPPGATPEDFPVDCRGWLLEDLVLTANRLGAIEIIRTPALLQSYRQDTYTFVLLTRGRWWAELDYGCIHVGSGQVCIMDFTVPWHVHGSAQENIMLVVPRVLVDSAVPNAPRLHGRLLEGGAGRLFAEHMMALVRHLPDMRLTDVPMVREATIGMIVGAVSALAADVKASRKRTTSATKIKEYIDANLESPDLDVARICHRLGVSRPTLYRALQDVGGVSGYIQKRRLEAAHARLSDSEESRTLAELADHYGFSSPAHFSTAFRRLFGYAPRSAKGAPMRPADAVRLFSAWQTVLKAGKD